MSLKFIVFFGHVDGPGELLTLGFVVDLLHGDAPLLTPETHTGRKEGFTKLGARMRAAFSWDSRLSPCHGDAGVQVVELGRAQGDLLVLLAVGRLHLQLHQLIFYPLNRLLLGLHGPAEQGAFITRPRHGPLKT